MTRNSMTVLLLFLLTLSLKAQSKILKNPDPHRFDKEINYFVQYDQKNSFPENAVLFVGSSSIRMWKTHLAFLNLPVINRGFGGAHISDVLFFYDELVKKYRPKLIVFYAGDNDIAAGKPLARVVNDFKTFVQKVKQDLPETRVIYLPIKPSVLRWKFWPEMHNTNQKIREICKAKAFLTFAGTDSLLLKDNGQPDASLFIEDGLHLNAAGYEKWNAYLRPLLHSLYKVK